MTLEELKDLAIRRGLRVNGKKGDYRVNYPRGGAQTAFHADTLEDVYNAILQMSPHVKRRL